MGEWLLLVAGPAEAGRWDAVCKFEEPAWPLEWCGARRCVEYQALWVFVRCVCNCQEGRAETMTGKQQGGGLLGLYAEGRSTARLLRAGS